MSRSFFTLFLGLTLLNTLHASQWKLEPPPGPAQSKSQANFDWDALAPEATPVLPKNLVYDNFEAVTRYLGTIHKDPFEPTEAFSARVTKLTTKPFVFRFPMIRASFEPDLGRGIAWESYDPDKKQFEYSRDDYHGCYCLLARGIAGSYNATNNYGTNFQVTKYNEVQEAFRFDPHRVGKFGFAFPMAPEEARKASGHFQVVVVARPTLSANPDEAGVSDRVGVTRFIAKNPMLNSPTEIIRTDFTFRIDSAKFFIIDGRKNMIVAGGTLP